MLKRILRAGLWRMQRWLAAEKVSAELADPIPFENSYKWLCATFLQLMRDPSCARRPAYIWGVLQGVALAKVLDIERVSVMEFGVAGGAGLLALEYIAEKIEGLPGVGVGVDVYGFDTGKGLPKPEDYRDCPNLWADGFYAMDKAQLEARLRRARLHLGLVGETVPAFLQTSFSPVAFISFDVDLYTSTRDALKLLEARHEALLPRIYCYFDDIVGFSFSEYNGERLAIAEFNAAHAGRKVSPLYGLKHFVPATHANSMWVDVFYLAHIFDHPLYAQPDELRKRTIIDIEGQCLLGRVDETRRSNQQEA
jgi:hypothetical protein